jgi:hypothetical protein
MPRAKKPVDAEQVKRLAAINCSYAEIAAVVGIDPSTLTRRFAQVIKEGRELGRSSLKRMMWKNAENGNTSMQIFLSKNILGYSDKVVHEDITERPTKVEIVWPEAKAEKKPEDFLE